MTDKRPVREFEVELPVGYIDDDGRIHRSALLRKMTGREETLLADRKLRRNGGRLVTELLKNCVQRLGEFNPINRQIVTRLSSPDRNYLLVELRKITFGQELEATYICPFCGETSQIMEDLSQLPVNRVNGSGPPDIVVELEDGYEDREGEFYTTMVFRLPTGLDEEKTASLMKDNPSQGMNALLSRCLLGVGDMPENRREALGTKLLNDLTMGDRARIERAFRQSMPGLDMNRTVECDSCGRRFTSTLDLTSFFSLQ